MMTDLIESIQMIAKQREMGALTKDQYESAVQDLKDEFAEVQEQLSFSFFDENGEDNEHYWRNRLEIDDLLELMDGDI